MLFISDILFANLQEVDSPDLREKQLVYYTKNKNGAWTKAGQWPQPYGYHGIVLHIDTNSTCSEGLDNAIIGCVVRVVLMEAESLVAAGNLVGNWTVDDKHNGAPLFQEVILNDLLLVHQSVHSERDILLQSFWPSLLNILDTINHP